MNPIAYTDVKGYAAARGVSTRSVQNWLADHRIPGAVMVGGRWSIPIDAQPTEPQAVIPAESPADLVPVPGPATLRTRRRPVPATDLAAEWAVPVATIRRWARNGEGGLTGTRGPDGSTWVWVETL